MLGLFESWCLSFLIFNVRGQGALSGVDSTTFGGPHGPATVHPSLWLGDQLVNPAIGYLGWIIIGALAGWIGSKLMGTDAKQGGLANIVVGIIGAVLGFWLAGALGIVAVGSVGAWIISILGAVVLIAILKALNVYK